MFTWGKIHKLMDELEMSAKPTRYYGIGVEDIGDRVKSMLEKSQLEYLTGGALPPSSVAEAEAIPNQEQLDQIQLGQEFGRHVFEGCPVIFLTYGD